MKIKDLIKKLQKLDENLEVIIAGDAEGNYASKLTQLQTSLYNSDWNEIIDEEDEEDAKQDKKTKKVVILWPE